MLGCDVLHLVKLKTHEAILLNLVVLLIFVFQKNDARTHFVLSIRSALFRCLVNFPFCVCSEQVNKALNRRNFVKGQI